MALIRVVKIGANERGLRFVGKEFRGVLRPGWHVAFDPLFRARVDVVSVREPWLVHRDLEVIARSGALGIEACVLDLAQHERALVWIDGRFAGIRTPGLSAVWTVFHKVRIEVVDARALRFEHPELAMILSQPGVEAALETINVEAGFVALLFVNGRLRDTLAPGGHAYWRGLGRVKALHVDLREQVADVAGQEIMTADKVTLRLNALATYRIVDAKKAICASDDVRQALGGTFLAGAPLVTFAATRPEDPSRSVSPGSCPSTVSSSIGPEVTNVRPARIALAQVPKSSASPGARRA